MIGAGRRGCGALVSEGELRVLGHLVRGPRRREDHRRDDLFDARELADELLHLLGDLRADRAGGGGQRVGDGHAAAVYLDPVDEPQFHEVQAQFGIDYVRKRLKDVVFVDHRWASVEISTRSGLYEPPGTLYLAGIVSFDSQLAILRIEGDEARTTSGRRRRPLSPPLSATRDV